MRDWWKKVFWHERREFPRLLPAPAAAAPAAAAAPVAPKGIVSGADAAFSELQRQPIKSRTSAAKGAAAGNRPSQAAASKNGTG